MLAILLNAFVAVSAYAVSPSLKIDQSLKINTNTKFTIIRNGTLSEEAITDMERNSPYCAIENIKLKPLSFRKGNELALSVKKLEFPNKDIKRFTLASTKSYSLYCDFTGKANFNEANITSEINSQLNPIMKVVE